MPDQSFLSQLKRVLVGARIPSHHAHHERLSRVTGLAVLSSDALSSVAYATEEILRVLLIGGIAAMSLVTPIGAVIAVTLADRRLLVPADDSRLPERGRRLHRRQGEPGHDAEPGGRVVAAHRLRAHRGGERRGGRGGADFGLSAVGAPPRRDRARVRRPADGGQPARRPRIGPHLRGAHLLLHRQRARACWASGCGVTSRAPSRRRTSSRIRPSATQPADHVRPADGVLERLHGDDRRGGGVERRARVPAAREPQRRLHARGDGGAVDHDVPRHHAARARLRARSRTRPRP